MSNLKTRSSSARPFNNFHHKILLATKAAGIAIWEFCLKEYRFFADDLLLEQYGVCRAEFEGSIQTWMDFIHPEDRVKVQGAIEQIALEGLEFELEYRIVRKDSIIRHIKATGIAKRNIDGTPIMIIGTSQDITITRIAEQRIKDSEAKYRYLFKNSLDAILFTDGNGSILEANPAACHIFKMTEEEATGLAVFGLLDLTDQRTLEALRVRDTKGQVEAEATFIRKDKTTFPGEFTSAVYKDANGNNRGCTLIRDVTRRKNAEELQKRTSNRLQNALDDLQKIMDSSLDVICTVDENGKFVTVSSAVKNVWGYEAAELIGVQTFQFWSQAYRSVDSLMRAKDGNELTLYEDKYVHKNGNVVNMLWSVKWDKKDRLFYCVGKDITDKKKLEYALESEKQRMYELFVSAPCCVGSFKGENHVFETANEFYLQITGRADVKGKTVREVFPEVENQGLFDLLDNVYKTGETFTASERLIRVYKQGHGFREVYLNFVYEAYRNKENNIEGVFFFAIDVTEQVQSRKEIEKREKELRKLIETAQEGIWLINEHDKTIFVNQKMCELLEYSEEEMLGKHVAVFKSKDCRQQYGNRAKNSRKGIREVFDTKYVTKSGRIICALVSANPTLGEGGAYTGTLRMVTDITERKLSEDRLLEYQEQLVQSQRIAHIGSWQVTFIKDGNKTACPIYCSDETYNIFGLTRREGNLSFRLFSKFIHCEDSKIVKDWFKNVYHNKLYSSVEFRIIDTNNNIRWLQQEARVVLDDETGEAVKMFGTLKDVTVTKEQELQIKKSTEEREVLVKELTTSLNDLKQFSYITSHNLRAPLCNLIGLLDLVEYGSLSETNKQIVEMFKGSTNQLNKTIEDLIQILIIKNKVNVSTTDNDICKVLSEASRMSGLDLTEVEINKDLKIKSVTFNRAYFQSIVMNLLSNSLKYRSAIRKLKIDVVTELNEKGEVVLRFADNGIGMDLLRYGNRIFGLYQKFHSNQSGRGLGLFMVKSQIIASGGHIEVESVVDQGTAFVITFPKEV